MQTKKVPDTSRLAKKTDYNAKVTEIESKIPTHPTRGRRDDVVATSLYPSQRHCRYVSNETLNDVSVERRQDVPVVCLHDVINERHDNVSRVRNNNVPLVRLHDISN